MNQQTNKVIDLTAQSSPEPTPQPSVAPRAQPMPGISGSLPMQVGEAIHVGNLTWGERKRLEEIGWKDGDPIPGNLADLMDEAMRQARHEATDVNEMMPPADPKTVAPLKPPEELKLEDLPPEQQERYRQIMQSALKQAREFSDFKEETQGLDPSVADAVRLASTTEIQDDTASDRYAAGGTPKEQPPAPKSQQSGKSLKPTEDKSDESTDPARMRCARCGWPKNEDDPVEPTNQDKDDFMQALLGLQPFIKLHQAFGNRLKVLVRTLAVEENDAVWQQIMADFNSGKIKTAADQVEWMGRYRTALQIIGIDGLQTPVKLPRNLQAWKETMQGDESALASPVTTVWSKFQAAIANNENVHHTLTAIVGQHNMLTNKLEANSQSPDFWTTVDA